MSSDILRVNSREMAQSDMAKFSSKISSDSVYRRPVLTLSDGTFVVFLLNNFCTKSCLHGRFVQTKFSLDSVYRRLVLTLPSGTFMVYFLHLCHYRHHALALSYAVLVCYRRLVLQSYFSSAPYTIFMLYFHNCVTIAMLK